MLNQFRKKITIMNVLMVSVVLLVVFANNCIRYYRQAMDNQKMGLQVCLNYCVGATLEKPQIGGQVANREPNGQPRRLTAFVGVLIGEDGQVETLNESNAVIDADVLAEGIAVVQEQVEKDGETSASDLNQTGTPANESTETNTQGEKEKPEHSGVLFSQNLLYMTRDTHDGRVIVFTDISEIVDGTRNTVLVSAVLFLACLGVLILISRLLSGLAVKPVEKAWTQQKRFVADASHELKTPLAVILANTSILLAHRGDTVESQGQWLESTDAEAKQMQILINQMLQLAKSDADQTETALGPLCVSDELEGILLSLEPVAYEKNMRIDSQIQPDITIDSDKGLFTQLVQIFLDNALKYGEAGTAVTVTLQSHSGGTILTVNNRGPVIASEDLPHIFDRFYRTDKARVSGNGYGLGLAIAANIAGVLHGELSVASNETDGTTFRAVFK